MADGFESDRTEAYFYGGMKDRPSPRRLKPRGQDESTRDENYERTKKPPRQG